MIFLQIYFSALTSHHSYILCTHLNEVAVIKWSEFISLRDQNTSNHDNYHSSTRDWLVICEVLLEWLFSMFLVNITSFNDVLINFMRICHVWREKYWMLRCLLSAIYSWYQWKWAHFYFKTGIPSTNVTFIAQSCSKELSFNSLDALYQIWNITITISHTKCMFVCYT